MMDANYSTYNSSHSPYPHVTDTQGLEKLEARLREVNPNLADVFRSGTMSSQTAQRLLAEGACSYCTVPLGECPPGLEPQCLFCWDTGLELSERERQTRVDNIPKGARVRTECDRSELYGR